MKKNKQIKYSPELQKSIDILKKIYNAKTNISLFEKIISLELIKHNIK